MKTIGQQLYDYIDDQPDCELMTSKGILIGAPDFDTLKAEFTWVNTEDTSLVIYLYCPVLDLIKTFQIKRIRDIENVTRDRLLELYYEGLAEAICYVTLDYTYGMTFKKVGGAIVAENERGVKHTVPAFEKIDTPDQYISYTKEYYKLMECNEN